jgi:hypothetical protein
MTTWHMHIAYRMPKATNTYSEYVILIAFSQQRWLQEHASDLHYMCIACLVLIAIGAIDNFVRVYLTWLSELIVSAKSMGPLISTVFCGVCSNVAHV